MCLLAQSYTGFALRDMTRVLWKDSKRACPLSCAGAWAHELT